MKCKNSAPTENEVVREDEKDCENNLTGGDGNKNQTREGESADISCGGT